MLPVDRLRFAIALERARLAADDPRIVPMRLASRDDARPLERAAAAIARLLPRARTRVERLECASVLHELAKRAGGVGAKRGAAIASMLAGDSPARAAAALAEARAPASDDAAFWNDVAAIRGATGRDDEVIAALAALDRALAQEPRRAEALFNRAAIVEGLGITPVAHDAWQSYLAVDAQSSWANDARARLAAEPPTLEARWSGVKGSFDRLSPASLRALAARFPQHVRLYAEAISLTSWAAAASTGDAAAAERQIAQARVVGEWLQRERGESLLAETVAAIERTPHDADVIAGLLSYRDGRIAYRDHNYETAERALRNAERLLSRARNPMARYARFYVANALFDESRVDEASAILAPMLAAERLDRPTHKALTARILYELALCEALRGRWSDSLAHANESAAIHHVLGEPGFEAAAEGAISEDYDLMGQPQVARRFGIAALRKACAFGDLSRARVTLAALSRTELRGGRWEWARALIRLETEIGTNPNPVLDADMHLRVAAAASHLGDETAAARSFLRARSAAQRISPAARAKLIADIDAVDGTLAVGADPPRAIALLTSAIDFQTHAARPIVLPELFLARGRAHAASGALDAARDDFDDGIRELEQQRIGVRDAELRPGIFGDAAELFDEVVALQLRRGGDPAEALAYVERGRARTLLEEIDGDRAVPPTAIAQLRQHLGPSTALVEYFALPDRLAIFVVRQRGVVLRVVPVERAKLASAANEFVDALSSPSPTRNPRPLGVQLHELLIAPVAADLAGVSTVVTIADGALQRVPFAALYDAPSRRYLIDRYTVATAPSAAVYVSALHDAAARETSAPSTALVFANPDVPRDRFPDLPSLERAEDEGRVVARTYRKADVFMHADATAERFLARAPAYEVVHYGGHAIVRPNEPGSSALLCAGTPQTGGELMARQIGRMRFTATRVVVLAACSTLTGRDTAVEGVSSLSSAFLVAGVPEIVGTLWDVDDDYVAPLMGALHAELARGASAASALRAAQLGALHGAKPELRDPRHWAAFAAIGAAPSPLSRQLNDRDLAADGEARRRAPVAGAAVHVQPRAADAM
jgi:CHAT domain-containing protein